VQRSSIFNGIWLCQICAKAIDSDIDRYTAELLHHWKREAEFHADARLAGHDPTNYLPQPASAVHALIPRIAGLTYDDGRERLLDAGWQPRMRHWSHGTDAGVQAGNGREFWERGYWEIINAWPTGLAQCTFAFHDVYGNLLTVLTQGEEIPETSSRAHVTNWFFTKEE
jgi:hypothetical protein